MNLPILAADWVGAVIGVLFLLISAASAIANAAKEKNKAQPGKTKEKAQLQKELEKFLQDAMNPQQAKKQEPRAQQARAAEPTEIDFFEDDGIEAAASTPRRQRRQRKPLPSASSSYQQKMQQAASKSPERKPKKKKVTHRERNELEEQKRQKRLGGSLRDRIEKTQKKHMQSRVHSQIDSKVGQ
ncbi:MAG: hypothetical protein ACF8CY_08210, partial [Gimesia chilikensis]